MPGLGLTVTWRGMQAKEEGEDGSEEAEPFPAPTPCRRAGGQKGLDGPEPSVLSESCGGHCSRPPGLGGLCRGWGRVDTAVAAPSRKECTQASCLYLKTPLVWHSGLPTFLGLKCPVTTLLVF